LSTRSPSFESSADSTVSEPSIATPTTIIVAIENDSKVLSPLNSIPAMAIITVAPEMSTERPDVAADRVSVKATEFLGDIPWYPVVCCDCHIRTEWSGRG
jgi:hypothetical protein